jgi:hypothetical protein
MQSSVSSAVHTRVHSNQPEKYNKVIKLPSKNARKVYST